MSSRSGGERRYRLAPQDRTGWMFGLGGAQIVILGAGVVVSVLGAQTGMAVGVAAVPALAAGMLSLVRIGGRSLVEWIPALWRWLRTGRGAGKLWLAPLARGSAAAASTPPLPPPLDDQVVLAVGADGSVAVVADRQADTYAASLRVAGRQFALVERGEQENLLAMWGDALAPFSAERTPVVEVRWSEWAAPAGMEEQLAYLAEHMIDDPHDPAVVSYRQLLRSAAPVATRHEVLVTVVVAAGRVVTKEGRGTELAAIDVLLGELRQFAARLERAGLVVSEPLSPLQLARALRVRLDPTVIPTLDRRGRSLGERAGLVELGHGGPLATLDTWRAWQVDGSHHRAFYLSEWPRSDVGATWMSDLLLYGRAVRTVTVSYQPVAPRASHRAVSRQAAKIESDAEHRRRTGFRVGATHRRAAQAIDEREEELVAGFPELEFAGVVSVAAPTAEALEEACADVVRVSAGCGLELRALDGRHPDGVGACLPLARGVAPKGLLR